MLFLTVPERPHMGVPDPREAYDDWALDVYERCANADR
jgi:hypothetical protein